MVHKFFSIQLTFPAYSPNDGSGTTYDKHTVVGVAPVNFFSGNISIPADNTTINGSIPDPIGPTWRSGPFSLTWGINGDFIIFKMTAKTEVDFYFQNRNEISTEMKWKMFLLSHLNESEINTFT
jgi:hypothetical protein